MPGAHGSAFDRGEVREQPALPCPVAAQRSAPSAVVVLTIVPASDEVLMGFVGQPAAVVSSDAGRGVC